MTQTKPRKERINLTIEQKLDYAKLMVHENYSNKKNRERKLNCVNPTFTL